LTVEFVIVRRFQALEFLDKLLRWVLCNVGLDGVLEISDESESGVQLNLERLVVNGAPGAGNLLLLAVLALLAQLGLDLVLVHEFDLPDVFLWEFKLMVLAYNLKPN